MEPEKAAAIERTNREVSADQKLIYYVLIYHDGCTLIPNSWVNINERIYVWPTKPILSRPKMHELKPNRTWETLEYTRHLGPYDTFQEALKIEEICSTNVSSTEDSEAIERTVDKFVHSKKRIMKPTIVYSPTVDKPPQTHGFNYEILKPPFRNNIVRENHKDSLEKHNQDTDAMPPTNYIVGSPKQDETRTPKLFDAVDSDSSNEKENLATRNAESPVTTAKIRKSSRNEENNSPLLYNGDDDACILSKLVLVPAFQKNGYASYLKDSDSVLCMNEATGQWYAVPNVSDARDALNIEHQLRNAETGVVERHFDSQSPEIAVVSIPVCINADEISGKMSISKEADKKAGTDISENDRVSPSLLDKSWSRRNTKFSKRL